MLLDIKPPCPPYVPAPSCPSSQFNSAHGFSSPKFVVGTSSLLRLFCFHALMNCKFHNPFLFKTIQNAGVCTPLALSSACSFPRARVTFLSFDTLLLRRYYQFFSYGTRSLLAVPAADSHETRLF